MYFLEKKSNQDNIFEVRDKNTQINLNFFNDATIHIDKYFSKVKNELITLKLLKKKNYKI
jgi:hypothetical protein